MKKGRGVLTVFLIFWTVFALTSFVKDADKIIGKSFVTSDEFQSELRNYYEGLYQHVLNTFDAEKVKEQITVNKDEIQYYRNYYGSLEEQVGNVASQYDYRIQEEGVSAEVKEVLKQERDRKIEEIKKNFADDAHVEAKIRTLKEQLIDKYAEERGRYRRDFLKSTSYSMFSYDLVNVETGQSFLNSSTNAPSIFKQQFTGDGGEYFTPDANGSFVYAEAMTDWAMWSDNVATSIDTEIYLDGAVEESYALLNHSVPLTLEQPKFTGTISLPKAALKNTELKRNYEGFQTFKMLSYLIWAIGLVTFAILLYIIRTKKTGISVLFPKIKRLFDKLPMDIALALALCGIILLIGAIDGLVHSLYSVAYYIKHNTGFLWDSIIFFVLSTSLFTIVAICAVWLMEDIRNIERWQKSFSLKLWQVGQEAFLNRSIGVQTVAILIIFFLAGIGFVGAMIDGKLFLIYIPLFLFILVPALYIFLHRMGYLNRVMKQTEDMAEGRLTSDIEVKGKSPIAVHAENLNKLRDGVRTSMTEQAKSERLKTELITNVSHDLRTPLTSIITYTDLLKKPDLSEEERSKYIDILDKKSARLKTLIEDLFDVSKMASGNVELLKQRVDLAQLLQQAIGEHEEAFVTANLDMRVNIESQPIFAYVDGQKWWRVIDNLIVNAQKYSLQGTRVYITLKQQGAEAELIVKNVAKYELVENVDELTERFKRADTSRHTEGSGLGLAIAQSIVDLHGARMKIEVDGDLFKVTVAVQVAY
ncbi:HAMP domain-containing sensor histidine kinase [Metasolibacillus sp.]|uniref:HAMP domain-containing sensor histidine kinase n=1 Tax=Metasolibacillus sp. TaxID=2703680 RepID=UPI0025FBD8AD|nr:HAMP domain-containing sensor histidine kinase [Metasolibacillus sp.]MCT6925217.1 HAMP domain-containing histidine kinase [Metasolibacillus sp.]MCT6941425.1 HAMP domain-containing histidine kinase [Metasolibacillus sp.]